MCIYGSDDEEVEKNHIMIHFPDHLIVDPGTYQDNIAKKNGGMEYCKKLVSGCDILVFSRLLGKITAGVEIEINHALTENKSVYELVKGKIVEVQKPVKGISRSETVSLYDVWRIRKLRSSLN